jgi:hypothetical protein
MTSFQSAVLQKAGWPRFSASGDIVEYRYTEFKKQWHKIDKTGVGDKKLLRIMWDYCLPKNLTKDPGRFADVDAVWAWLEKLFGPNGRKGDVQLGLGTANLSLRRPHSPG